MKAAVHDLEKVVEKRILVVEGGILAKHHKSKTTIATAMKIRSIMLNITDPRWRYPLNA